MKKETKKPKQRILEAATSLFAQKGYAAVGVREIAKKADVNISMISYYFNGKAGILGIILEEFFGHYFHVLSVVDDESLSAEECVRTLAHSLVNFARENMELIIIFENVIPLELHEIDEVRDSNLRQMMDMRSRLVARFGIDPDDIFSVGTFGPMLTDIIFAKSRRIPVIKRLSPFMIDDAMYERYAEAVADLFLYGITGITDLNKEINN
ncbi:TetR family transcriptional regulator [Candidatus Poribacteria bacterium]